MIVAANWKMHKTTSEAREWVEAVVGRVPEGVQAVVFPPFTALQTVREAASEGPLIVGAQNMFYAESGAFTGEISPDMLTDFGCRFVLVGHSERRFIFGETDKDVAVKLRFTLGTPLIPVLCVGESVLDFERGDTLGALRRQLGIALKGLPARNVRKIVFAYEPVWAIGTGKAATTHEAEVAAMGIRDALTRLYDENVASAAPILYGGSVGPENVRGYLGPAGLQGVLVGSASLDPDVFVELMWEASTS